MAKTIEQIRAELMAAQNPTGGQGGAFKFTTNASFPFWNAPAGTTSIIRFLPDSDTDRIFFWRERRVIQIPFATVEGHPDLTNVLVEVPCIKMYNKKNTCPILQDTRTLWKTDQEDIARIYWPKKSFLYQGFVVDTELEEEALENPIRRFTINPSIHKIIEASLTDPEMDANPADQEFGYDFRIVKTQQTNGYADYSTSGFARRNRPLNATEKAAVEEHGLYDLSEFLPREPDAAMMDIIVAMYEESRKPNSVYKLEWANTYTPKGARLNLDATNTNSEPSNNSNMDEDEDEVPFNTAPAPVSNSDDIVNQLRARMQQGNG